ncbi:unnamed protein product [Mucor hiemalis]
MAILLNSRNCCFVIPLQTGVYLLTIFGLLNKLSGFYGLISLDYSDVIVVCIHVYSLLALGVFAAGLYGISKEKYNFIRWFTMFTGPEEKQQHDDTFKAESIVSIVFLVLIRFIHLYFAIVLTTYYKSLGQSQYSKVTAAIDEELNYDEMEENEDDTSPLSGRRR